MAASQCGCLLSPSGHQIQSWVIFPINANPNLCGYPWWCPALAWVNCPHQCVARTCCIYRHSSEWLHLRCLPPKHFRLNWCLSKWFWLQFYIFNIPTSLPCLLVKINLRDIMAVASQSRCSTWLEMHSCNDLPYHSSTRWSNIVADSIERCINSHKPLLYPQRVRSYGTVKMCLFGP